MDIQYRVFMCLETRLIAGGGATANRQTGGQPTMPRLVTTLFPGKLLADEHS